MRWFPLVLAGLVALKAVDVAARMGPTYGTGMALGTVAVWLAAAWLLGTGRQCPGAAVLVGAVAVAAAAGLHNQHLWLFGWIALGMLLLDGEDLRLYLRGTLTVVYLFAAVSKVNPWFLSGDTLTFTGLPGWLLPTAALGAVAAEAWLAVGLWSVRTRRPTIALGVLVHASIVALVAVDPVHVVRLTVFNGLMVALYLPFLGGRHSPHLSTRYDSRSASSVEVSTSSTNPISPMSPSHESSLL